MFCFLYALTLDYFSSFRCVSNHDRNYLFPHPLRVSSMMCNMLTGYNIGYTLFAHGQLPRNDILMNGSLENCVYKTSLIAAVGPSRVR